MPKEFSSNIYESTAKIYNVGRKADPVIVKTIGESLIRRENGLCLDIGCGTGNYTNAFAQIGFDIQGADLSPSMLREARQLFPHLIYHEADMRSLPFSSCSYDNVITINTLHYVRHSMKEVFNEIKRILKPGGNLTLLLVSLEQCLQFWVGHYFPFFWDIGKKILTPKQEILNLLEQTGFKNLKAKPYYTTETSEDLYVYACKYRPELLLDPQLRKGMSPFQRPEYQESVISGCKVLEDDILTGKIQDVVSQYESGLGEGLFVSCSI